MAASSLSTNLRSLRARPVTFDLGDGRTVTIRPPTLAQTERCLQLEAGQNESPTAAEAIVRFAEQARILLGPEHEPLLDQLNQQQIAEIVGALYVAASGLDPVQYVRWQQKQREAGIVVEAMELLRNVEEAILDLSARKGKTGDEIGEMSLAEAVAQRERIAKLERVHFEALAIINGRKLTWGG